MHKLRRSCRCRPHLLRKLRRYASDSSAPDSTYSRRLQFSPHHGTTRGAVVKSILLGFPLSVVLDIVLGIIIPDNVIRLVLVFIVPFLLVGGLLVAFGTVTKNQWGINTKPVNCPACGCPVPKVRQPKSIRQAHWGGWTCEKCGCEMDKWGRLTSLAR